jgi:hypothetical protein
MPLSLLKGRYSCVASPDGKLFFNSSGNPGMATGGSGDVLTGIITAFAAQDYSAIEATLIGMYIHGIAGDIAANNFSQEAMIASDIIESLPEAFKVLFYTGSDSGRILNLRKTFHHFETGPAIMIWTFPETCFILSFHN